MLKNQIKQVLKTALGVVIIYAIAVFLSLLLCDRVTELESSEDRVRQNGSIVLQIR